MAINLGVTAGSAKVADDTLQLMIEAIVSTATDVSTAGVRDESRGLRLGNLPGDAPWAGRHSFRASRRWIFLWIDRCRSSAVEKTEIQSGVAAGGK